VNGLCHYQHTKTAFQDEKEPLHHLSFFEDLQGFFGLGGEI
jgi:hypothetical protein